MCTRVFPFFDINKLITYQKKNYILTVNVKTFILSLLVKKRISSSLFLGIVFEFNLRTHYWFFYLEKEYQLKWVGIISIKWTLTDLDELNATEMYRENMKWLQINQLK